MIRRALLACLVFGLAACNQGSSSTAFRLEQPSALTVFHGVTARHAGVWPYVAVANSAQDELVMLDPVDETVVAAPVLLRPLSIPLPSPRPALLASARFTRPDGAAERPDLLVAVSAGSSELQLIRTWHDDGAATGPGLADETPVDLGAPILAIVAAPAVIATGEDVADVADRVRVVAALAGNQIAVVEYVWSGDPSDATGRAASAGGPVFQDVGFEGLSLAVDPKYHRFVYAATLDPIGSSNVMGVAQLDMTLAVGSWPVQAIDAKAPTRLVAAYKLRERMLTAAGAYDQGRAPTAEDGGQTAFQAEEKHRVYALRDPGACGPRTEVACGIAVLDPETYGVLEDPWHPGRDLPPITSPSTPVALVVGQPAKNPPANGTNGLESSELMLINPITPRLTTGVLLLPSADGRNYFADLARWETPSNSYEILSSVSGVGVSAFTPSNTLLPRLGFYPPNGTEPDANTSASAHVGLTPGFTPSDRWTITFQGYLPDFAASRAATIELLDGTAASTTPNTFLVSLQTTTPGASAPTQVVNVYDPALGIHVGDIVEFWTDGSTTSDTPHCPDTTRNPEAAIPPIEGKITEIRAPDAGHPGGSLVIVRGDCVPWARGVATTCESEDRGPWTRILPEDCWNLLPNAGTVAQSTPPHLGAPRQLRIRAGSGAGASGSEEFVVVGAATGYAGRAVASPTDPGSSKPTYKLENDGEATLVASCPLIPYPAPGAAVPACDATCRTTCERAWLARRARRLHLTSVRCPTSAEGAPDSYCETHFPDFNPVDANASFPPPEGPALAFSLGWHELVSGDGKRVVRDTRVSFTTRSGRTPSSRWGGGGDSGPATQPTGGAWFDRTEDPAWNHQDDRYRFYVPYVGNLVLDLSPALDNDNTRVLR